MGTLEILTIGKGDEKIVIETDEDVKTVGEKVKTMLKQGFLITTESGEKVTGYNGEKGTFIIAGKPQTEVDPKSTTTTAVAPVGGG